MTSRSEVHHANNYTIEASYKKGQIFHVESYNVLLFGEVKIQIHVTCNEWILEQFFLTVGQNNFGNKIPFLIFFIFQLNCILLRSAGHNAFCLLPDPSGSGGLREKPQKRCQATQHQRMSECQRTRSHSKDTPRWRG